MRMKLVFILPLLMVLAEPGEGAAAEGTGALPPAAGDADAKEVGMARVKRAGECKDTHSNCPFWAKNHCQGKYSASMAQNCPKSCKLCTPGCSDKDRYAAHCPGWATLYCNGQYEAFMTANCPKSCNKCKLGDWATCAACLGASVILCTVACFITASVGCYACVAEFAPDCLETCGFPVPFRNSEFGLKGARNYRIKGEPAPANVSLPACVQAGRSYKGTIIPGMNQTGITSAFDCGTYCNTKYQTQTVAWNWFTGKTWNGKDAQMCVCLESRSPTTVKRPFVNCGLGPANGQKQCPPVGAVELAVARDDHKTKTKINGANKN